jgi:hypothetical protein
MVMRPTMVLVPFLMLFTMAGCATARTFPQPIIEPSAKMQRVGEHDAAQDLRFCRDMVRDPAPVSMQPRWLPPLGVAENGVVLGTVDEQHQVWLSRDAFRQAIERCLRDRGYEIRGWQ